MSVSAALMQAHRGRTPHCLFQAVNNPVLCDLLMQPPAVPSARAFFLQIMASAAVDTDTWVATGSAGLL